VGTDEAAPPAGRRHSGAQPCGGLHGGERKEPLHQSMEEHAVAEDVLSGLPMRKDQRSSNNQEMKPIGYQAGPRKLTCDPLVQNGTKPVCVCGLINRSVIVERDMNDCNKQTNFLSSY
jgi:hypothetical protein